MTGRSSGPTRSMMASAIRRHLVTNWSTFRSIQRGDELGPRRHIPVGQVILRSVVVFRLRRVGFRCLVRGFRIGEIVEHFFFLGAFVAARAAAAASSGTIFPFAFFLRSARPVLPGALLHQSIL